MSTLEVASLIAGRINNRGGQLYASVREDRAGVQIDVTFSPLDGPNRKFVLCMGERDNGRRGMSDKHEHQYRECRDVVSGMWQRLSYGQQKEVKTRMRKMQLSDDGVDRALGQLAFLGMAISNGYGDGSQNPTENKP